MQHPPSNAAARRVPGRFRLAERPARRAGALLFAVLFLAALTAGCGADSHHKKHSSSSSSGCSLAWCAPVGDPVIGATLYHDWADLRLVPAPVNVTGGWTDSVAVTSDGMHLYFGYTKYDFTAFFQSIKAGGPVVFDPSGPDRAGMTGDAFQIFRAALTASGWSVTYLDVNDPAKTYASATVNAAQDLLVFSDFVGGSAIAQLNFSTLVNGDWTTPQELPGGTPIAINANCPGGGDDNGFVVGDLDTTVTLTWESRRIAADGTCGTDTDEHHLYQATYMAGTDSWSAIQPVPGLNEIPGSDDTQVSFSTDGNTAYWTSIRAFNDAPTYGVFTADWNGSSYANARPVITPTYPPGPFANKLVIQGELNVAEVPEGWIGYLMCGIAQSDHTAGDGSPDDIALHVCRMRKPR